MQYVMGKQINMKPPHIPTMHKRVSLCQSDFTGLKVMNILKSAEEDGLFLRLMKATSCYLVSSSIGIIKVDKLNTGKLAMLVSYLYSILLFMFVFSSMASVSSLYSIYISKPSETCLFSMKQKYPKGMSTLSSEFHLNLLKLSVSSLAHRLSVSVQAFPYLKKWSIPGGTVCSPLNRQLPLSHSQSLIVQL